ncbi:hypothetical protein [Actinophytocola algeriensis]|uniref:Uncharacterized protein n=1 Tax=Actinophytocola algeriensis TaxID=1768010 RepID=A0A7W7QCF2_9PSEU|nr:hypothetical protein [Actinophytocola algeriensis]MBB4911076.1 hypothetical protein [Actinophytocola algeriensis]MBE1479015.1 hypothetical protein [Actinophytocola algeriensis]
MALRDSSLEAVADCLLADGLAERDVLDGELRVRVRHAGAWSGHGAGAGADLRGR